MATHYRRIDTTDPRRHDRVKPVSFPDPWNDDSTDIYGFLLSSATMLSGAAMVTRLPTLAFFGLIFSMANYVHDKPHQAKKETAQGAAGPVMGLVISTLGIVLIVVQKLLGLHSPLPLQLGKSTTEAKP